MCTSKNKFILFTLSVFSAAVALSIVSGCSGSNDISFVSEISQGNESSVISNVENSSEDVKKDAVTDVFSNDMFCFSASVNGNIISLPCRVDEFEKIGLNVMKYTTIIDYDETIASYSSRLYHVGDKNGNYFSIDLGNFGPDNMKLRDCVVTSMSFESTYSGDMDFVFPCGIAYGTDESRVESEFRKLKGEDYTKNSGRELVDELKEKKFVTSSQCLPIKKA